MEYVSLGVLNTALGLDANIVVAEYKNAKNNRATPANKSAFDGFMHFNGPRGFISVLSSGK